MSEGPLDLTREIRWGVVGRRFLLLALLSYTPPAILLMVHFNPDFAAVFLVLPNAIPVDWLDQQGWLPYAPSSKVPMIFGLSVLSLVPLATLSFWTTPHPRAFRIGAAFITLWSVANTIYMLRHVH